MLYIKFHCFILSPGAVLEMTIVIGVLKTSGIFFVNFQERFDSTSSMTSLISTVQNGVFSVAGMYTKNGRIATSRYLHQSIDMYINILYCIIIPTLFVSPAFCVACEARSTHREHDSDVFKFRNYSV